ncbi:biotin--[acetyl-CoA-carboxylase] ligase [Mycolicibacterium holsaticum]|uniref:biotin--[acetyl-CoA-carboxylase] ligase n=1 Tax=Mycolicibacterium holsaticum TaxID=152142 RepID=UPI001C7E0831|nr:biotin--[acetyl-CoA-carboxylase] ligase [Mycolicibacterium holsaticum]MDA4108952.1 biotin--acetyl-CoA-carboxylase ligase [Mycolicibacterium holsaticum DSM 44478 = JCM 12374]QZA15417.1 biotin--[acetyl-CoA-carboxylase] ligase [Mycolicibacterium holsaticum DSM 44478 = JCM 12374]UNC12311.1 biotin--[acetyl-CoA-carboxylase] ligase [Mycolicibacterium holsaticum DSM 44478 = JCM 12374]
MTADRVRLDETTLRDSVIGTSPLWRRIDVVAETGSTNADLITRADRGEVIDGAVLIAENQTAGRGRQGRSWSAVPYAQITMSVGVDAASVPSQAWGWLPLATGVAIVDAVADSGVQAGLKWPNDVLAGDGKLAGILAEVAAASQAVVVGIGLNVSLRGDEIGVPGVTSLVDLGVPAPDRQDLLRRVLHELGRRIEAWRRNEGADPALIADYRARSLTLGRPVRAMLPGGREIVGVARDIDDQGRLDIDADGQSTKVSAGDIVHLRPAD